MARPLRVNRANGWYHAYARGLNRMDLYADERDRKLFLELLDEMVERYRVQMHAYALMDNHFHLTNRLVIVSTLARSGAASRAVRPRKRGRSTGSEGSDYSETFSNTTSLWHGNPVIHPNCYMLNSMENGVPTMKRADSS